MKKNILAFCLIVFVQFLSLAQPACGTCASPTCAIYGPVTGTSLSDAAAKTKTALEGNPVGYGKDLNYDAGLGMAAPLTGSIPKNWTYCYKFTISNPNTSLGLKLGLNLFAGSPSFIAHLYKESELSCISTVEIPANRSKVDASSFFNPEWDGLAAGNYKVCIDFSLPTSGDMIGTVFLGYYTNNIIPSGCSANPGTFSITKNTNIVTGNSFDLGTGDKLTITSNSDYTLPTPSGTDIAGVGFAAFTCDPSTLDLTLKSTFTNATCYKGYFYNSTFNDVNDGSTNSSGKQLGVTTYWLVPITFDDYCTTNPAKSTTVCKTGTWDIGNINSCFKAGTPIKINYVVTPACNMKNGVVNTCDCIFTDSQGESAKYQNGEDFTYIMCPDSPSKKLMLTFNSLVLNGVGDKLKILDGDNALATSIFAPLSTTPLPTAPIKTSISNTSGCLTAVFQSDGTGRGDGWSAKISCYTPCTPPVASATTVENGVQTNIKSCIDKTLNFDGSSSIPNSIGGIVKYAWDFGDGSTDIGPQVSHTYNKSGIFSPTLIVTNADGCQSTNSLSHVVNIASKPNFKGSITGSVCLNSEFCLEGKVNYLPINKIINISTPTVTDIPVSSGVTEIPITVTGYNSGQKIISSTDIQSILVNMEHSAISDIVLTLISPDGKKVILYKQSAPNAGGASVLGKPTMDGAALDGSCSWGVSLTGRGTGFDYFFKSTATSTMVDIDEKYDWTDPRQFPARQALPSPPCISIPSDDYKPIDPFSNLINADINGTWILQVQDNVNNDDGTLFNWKINFNPTLLTSSLVTPVVSSHKWTAISGSDIKSTSGATTNKLCISPSLSSNTDYKYEIEDDFACKYDTTLKIVINDNPTLTATPTSILVGGTSSVSVSGGSGIGATSNAWKTVSGTANTISGVTGNTQPITVTGVAAGNEDVVYTDNKGCDDTVTIAVSILGCNTITKITADQTWCQGIDPNALEFSTNETAANGINFIVYPSALRPTTGTAVYAGGVGIKKETPVSGKVSLDLPKLGTTGLGALPVVTAGEYYVYAILDPVPSNAACRSYAEIKVTIKDSIIPVITAGTITSNNTTFTWNDIPSANKFGVDTARLVSLITTIPWKSANDVLNTTAGTGNTFTFNSIPLGQTAHIKITPLDNTNNKLACSNSAISSIINPSCIKPDLLPLNIPDTVCAGESLEKLIGKISSTSVLVNFEWISSTDCIVWTTFVSNPDFVITNPVANKETNLAIKSKLLMNNSFVRLVGKDLTGQCSDSTLPVKILVNEIPDATISISPDPAKLCLGDPKSIEVTFQGSKGLQPYRFDFKLDGLLKDTVSASIPGDGKVLFPFNTINLIEDSTFILDSITDKNGCTAKFTGKTVKLEVVPVPQPEFQADKTIGCYPLEVIFTDKSAVLNTDVVWDFGNGDLDSTSLGVVKYVFQKSGDYTINFKSTIAGCWDTVQKTNYIHVKDRPEAQFSPKKTNISLIDPEIQFINSSSSNSVYYKWIFGDGSPVSNLENPKHMYIGDGSNGLPDPGKYTVELYAYINQDCWDSTSTIITIDDEQIYYIPNTFTPNGDEKNNTFQPVFTSGYDAQNYHFLIYNRWGELIFESNNPTIGWDGTYANKLLGNDSYTWKLQFKEKMTEKEHYLTGHVNLLK